MKRGDEAGSSPAGRLSTMKDRLPSALGSPLHRERASAKKDKVSRDPRTGKGERSILQELCWYFVYVPVLFDKLSFQGS